MFGNVTELKDLALPPMEDIKKYNEDDSPRNNDREDFKFDSKDVNNLLALIPVDLKQRKYAYDILEFNAIMESLSKTVMPKRRAWWWPTMPTLPTMPNVGEALSNAVNYLVTQASIFGDAAASYGMEAGQFLSEAGDVVWEYVTSYVTISTKYDSNYYRGREDSADESNLEDSKMANIEKLMLCLLIHARYRVDLAIRQRAPILDIPKSPSLRARIRKTKKVNKNLTTLASKRYRLGYLFNRLRRVKYLQAKAVQSANTERLAAEVIRPAFGVVHDNFGWKLVRWYQKMIHLDQDVRDLCSLVYDTLEEETPVPKRYPKPPPIEERNLTTLNITSN